MVCSCLRSLLSVEENEQVGWTEIELTAMLQTHPIRLRETYYSGSDATGPSLLPDVEMLGWARFPRTQIHGLSAHRHDAYEFCWIADGSVVWWVEEERFSVGRGEVFFTRPGELHGGWDRMMHPCELYWVQVRIAEDATLPGWDVPQTEEFRRLLDRDGVRHFPAHPSVSDSFLGLLEEFRSREQPLGVEMARSHLHRLMVQIVRDRLAATQREMEPPLSAEITAALEWMQYRLSEPFCIQEVAAAIGLHPSRFHDRFLNEVGQTPAEWRMRQRIAAAERLLQGDAESITDVAFALGFASSQYFATAFKKYTGWTPTAYRQRYADATGRKLAGLISDINK